MFSLEIQFWTIDLSKGEKIAFSNFFLFDRGSHSRRQEGVNRGVLNSEVKEWS